VLQARGMTLDFWKIAMRPGKPLMFGRLGRQRVLGLPGNPVSSLICARVFLVPLIARMLGTRERAAASHLVRAAVPLAANGPRQHYMRAVIEAGDGGGPQVRPVRSQDSSLLSPLAEANALIVRPPRAPSVAAGQEIEVMLLDF
jgi:molybdopterin molybdotransferase